MSNFVEDTERAYRAAHTGRRPSGLAIPDLETVITEQDYRKLLHLLRVSAGYGADETERFLAADGMAEPVLAWSPMLSLGAILRSEWGSWLGSELRMPEALLAVARWAMLHDEATVLSVKRAYDPDDHAPYWPNQAGEDYGRAEDTYRLAVALDAGTLTGRDAGSYADLPEGAHYDQFTTHMAAEIFGVTVRQIQIRSRARGVGRKHGRDWLLTAADLLALRPGPMGRPPKPPKQREGE